MKWVLEKQQDIFCSVLPYHLVTFLKFPDFRTRYSTLEPNQVAPSRKGKLSVFSETLWGEQKPGLQMCSFLCILLPKLMITGLLHALCHSPPHRPSRDGSLQCPDSSVPTKEAGSL